MRFVYNVARFSAIILVVLFASTGLVWGQPLRFTDTSYVNLGNEK